MRRGVVSPHRKTLTKATLLVFAVALFSSLYTTEVLADTSYCVVVSIENNAWVTRKDATVKSSLKVGDRLHPGDRLEVYQGNIVDVAFDKSSLNILHIKGETFLEITSLTPTDVSIEDKKGNVYALIDNPKRSRQFQITTPTAVAAVRGTQFHVNYSKASEVTQVSTYRGSVRVYGKDASGQPTYDYVSVNAGEKTKVMGSGEAPLPPTKLSSSEMRNIDVVRKSMETIREWLGPRGSKGEIGKSEKDQDLGKTKTKLIKDDPNNLPEDGSLKSKDGKLFF